MSTFLPSSIFKRQRGCVCELKTTQIEEINGLRGLSYVGTCAGACQKIGYQNISAMIAFGVYF